MMSRSLVNIKDFLHAKLCYQLLNTPLRLPLEKKYRDVARMACEYIQQERTEILHYNSPRHFVIHHFVPGANANGKKVFITHGWLSRAAYMTRFIASLHQQGFEVYAVDLPAHGESKGIQLRWYETVTIFHQIINELGPFYAVLGHSYGGAMLLHTLNLASHQSDWKINALPERAVLLASPTRMRTPIIRWARYLKLNPNAYFHLRKMCRRLTPINPNYLHLRYYQSEGETQYLCIHGEDDNAIKPTESIIFCDQHPYASCFLMPGIDHINILFNQQVENKVCEFFSPVVNGKLG